MRKLFIFIFLFLVCLFSCIKEDHYDKIDEVQGIGLPYEVNSRTKIIYAHQPFFESFNEEQNLLTLYNIDETPALRDSDILVIGLDTSGVIRRVTDITETDDGTIQINTELATMEDVFIDAEFKLSTDLIQPKSGFKSADLFTTDNTEALTDEDGFIHPVQIVLHKENGEKVIKSALDVVTEKSGDIKEGDYVFGESLHKYKSLEGISFYKKNDVEVFIDSGFVEFAPVFKFEFKFEPPNINFSKLEINKGELHKFKFYSDKTKFDFLTRVKLLAEKEYTVPKKSDEPKEVLKDIIKVSFVFAIGPVPVYMDINCDLFADYDISFKGKIEASAGFQSTHYVTLGAEYYKNTGWERISEYDTINKVIPFKYGGVIDFYSHFEIYPRFEVMFYKVIGPYLEVVPYVDAYCTVLNENGIMPWNANIDLGVDLRSGVDVKFLNNSPSFPPFEVAKWPLYSAPYKLTMVSGSGQSQVAGKKLDFDLTVKVTDIYNNPLPFVPVYFSSNKGGTFENDIVSTKRGGIAKAKFKVGSLTGEGNIKALIVNGKKEQIGESLEFKYAVLQGNPAKLKIDDKITKTQSTATLICKVTELGDATLVERGIFYSKDQNLAIGKIEKVIDDKNEVGEYKVQLDDLQRATQYYAQAYARDVNDKLYYSPIKPFRTEADEPEIYITKLSQESDGTVWATAKIEDNGGNNITEIGFVYSKLNPSIDDNRRKAETGNFRAELLGMDAGVSYNVKAYVECNHKEIYYSDKESITTKADDTSKTPPEVTNAGYEFINDNTAKIEGKITNEGGSNVTEVGFYWALKGDELGQAPLDNIIRNGDVFETTISPLEVGKTYEYSAYAKNNEGSSMNVKADFVFSSDAPAVEKPKVETGGYDNPTQTSVTLKGKILKNGGAEIENHGFVISTERGFNPKNGTPFSLGKGKIGEFEKEIPDLEPGETYYYRAYAKNDAVDEVDYGDEEEFETMEEDNTDPTIEKPDVETLSKSYVKTEIGKDYAILWGEIVDDGGAEIEKKGIEVQGVVNGYYETKESELPDGDKFGASFVPLESGEYEYRAYAINSEGEDNGVWEAFTIEDEQKEPTEIWVGDYGTILKEKVIGIPSYEYKERKLGVGIISDVSVLGVTIGKAIYRSWAEFDISNLPKDIVISRIMLKMNYSEINDKDAENSRLNFYEIDFSPLDNSLNDKEKFKLIVENENKDERTVIESHLFSNGKSNNGWSMEVNIKSQIINAITNNEKVFRLGMNEDGDDSEGLVLGSLRLIIEH